MLKIAEYLEQEFLNVIQQLNFGKLEIVFHPSKNNDYGDIYTNVACQLAHNHNLSAAKIAKDIVSKLDKKLRYIGQIKAEENGFINLSYSPEAFSEYYGVVLDQKERIGSREKTYKWKFIEVVSANPTGLLHIGHARNGIFSDTLANLMEYLGYSVHREYLVNDIGNQIHELIKSVWFKYKTKFFNTLPLESNEEIKYSGPEIDECLDALIGKFNDSLLENQDIFKSPIFDELRESLVDYFLNEISKDLGEYQISVNSWRRESSFVDDKSINDLLNSLQNHLSFTDGAVWFKAGDFLAIEKDEVLIKKSGMHTYYCQDLIYHTLKFQILGKGGETINVLGSDHIGHIDKLRSFFIAKKIPQSQYRFVTLQMVKLLEKGKTVKMSKRNSTVINIRDLKNYMTYEEVRWFLVSHQPNSPTEIDIDKLKEKDYKNPVYYVMYAYSRIVKILGKSDSSYLKPLEFKHLNPKEKELFNLLISYEDTLEISAKKLLPHQINQYLFTLAKLFHSYYEETPILEVKDKEALNEKLALLYSIKNTIHSGLSLLKISPRDEL